MRKIVLAVLAVLAVFGLGLAVPVAAVADGPQPPCAAFDTCRYMPNP